MSAGQPWGTGLLYMSTLVWLSVSVGPWWLGVVLFCAAWVINIVEYNMSPRAP